jgi:hypothetical protein
MRTRPTSALLPAVALVLAGCTFDFNRYDPSDTGSDAGAQGDIAAPESSIADGQGPSDVGSGDTGTPDNPGDANGGSDAGVLDAGGRDATSNESGAPSDGGNEAAGPTYTIGGMLRGMKPGRSVTLQDNGGDDLVVPTNGSFVFSQGLGSGAGYDVTVSAQPPSQTCTATAGSGVVASSNVTDVVVTCR